MACHLDDWRFGGGLIEEVGQRREAFNLMLSMPRGTDPLIVQRAARELAQAELADHKYVMVLHDHQANPHMHLSVRAESKHGQCLNRRMADIETVRAEVTAWQAIRDQAKAKINWQFPTDTARTKLKRIYPTFDN